MGRGATRKVVDESACRDAMAKLMMLSASEVVLRPKRWEIALSSLVAGLPGVGADHQALPVHVRARDCEAGKEAEGLSSDEVDARVAEIIQAILTSHNGWFDRAWISHKWPGMQPAAKPMYSRLNKLLKPGQLKPFLGRHPDFAWQPKAKNKGMIVSWAADACAPAAVGAGSRMEELYEKDQWGTTTSPSL